MPLAKGNIKTCSSCKIEKTIKDFSKNIGTKDKLQNACNSCKAQMTRNWKYAMKNGDIERMIVEQGGCCAICLKKTDDIVLDHCHKTGTIRQMLCRKCNAVLGMCDDNILILKASIEYINKWTEE